MVVSNAKAENLGGKTNEEIGTRDKQIEKKKNGNNEITWFFSKFQKTKEY